MSGLPSAGDGYGARHPHHPHPHPHHPHHHHHHHLGFSDVVSEFLAPTTTAASTGASNNNNKRRRRPAGTPDPDAEVVALSSKTLMESDRYVCEICNQGFQRDQNLQMHRRRHKVPWKLLKKPSNLGTNKRVYICPERSCLHHDPSHALGDLVGIKKHYRRKHCTEKQWKCVKCSKRYAVQSDYKAHLKTCGTRGHCCECGRVFSRVESFIEHQDTCGAVKHKHSGGGASERKPPTELLHQDVADRMSLDSRSQSSDTTQALPFTQPGVLDTTAGARSADSSQPAAAADVDYHSQRVIFEAQQPAYNATMPAWLMDLRSSSNKLELLQQRSKLPKSSLANSDFPSVRRVVVDHGSCNSAAGPTDESKPVSTLVPENLDTSPSLSLSIGRMGSVDQVITSADMPCLRLSIGPSTAESAAASCRSQYADSKPAVGFGSRESFRQSFALAPASAPALASSNYQSRSGTVGLRYTRVQDHKSSGPAGNDLALWIPDPATVEGPTRTSDQQQSSTLRDFLAQAWRPCSAMQGCGSR